MRASLGKVTLRSGESMEIVRIQPPEPESTEFIQKFLAHKGRGWYDDLCRRLAGEHAQVALDTYLFGLVDDEPVGQIWYTVPADTRDVGTLGHVYTPEAQRQKGICNALMEALGRCFREEGGRAMYLSTGGAVPRRIYESYGFSLYNPPTGTGGVFQWVVNDGPNFEENYFRNKGRAVPREMHWGDLPRVEALLNIPGGWFLRDWTFNVARGVSFEGQFLGLMERLDNGSGVCLALESPDQVMVGMATLMNHDGPLQRFQSHTMRVDLFVHPNYYKQAGELIEAVVKRARSLGVERLYAHVVSADREKSQAFCDEGFVRQAILSDYLRAGEDSYDLEIWGSAVE